MSDYAPGPLRLDTGRARGDVSTADLGGDQSLTIGEVPSAPPLPKDVLDGHFQLGKEIGRGGMGVVFEAENLRTGKAVAIKCLNSGGRGSVAAERMRREARAIAKICHPHVVQLYDLGGTDRAPFLVMELLRGETLLERLERGRFDWDEAVELLLPVIDAVHAVHKVGIVHRDLKPDNIFLCHVEGVQTVVPKVLDFGVASWTCSAQEELMTLTRAGTMLGTPAYMAIEQLTGGSVDPRTDVYALAATLYRMLTGEPPFVSNTTGELAILQATTRPKRPSSFNASVRGERDAVLLKALSREPDARFGDAAAFALALKSARPDRKFHQSSIRTGALAAATLLGVLVWHFADTSGVDPLTADGPATRNVLPAPEQAPDWDVFQVKESFRSTRSVQMAPTSSVLGARETPVAPRTPPARKAKLQAADRESPSARKRADVDDELIPIELEDFYDKGSESALP